MTASERPNDRAAERPNDRATERPNDRIIVVTAALVERDGCFLVTRRPRGVHLAGCWEFPGGKCEAGEAHEQCLEREILEELGTGVVVGSEVLTVSHEYPERKIELHFFRCTLKGEPRPLLGQDMRWVHRDELGALEFPPADAELIARLQRTGSGSG